jgi:hypothetical protein
LYLKEMYVWGRIEIILRRQIFKIAEGIGRSHNKLLDKMGVQCCH